MKKVVVIGAGFGGLKVVAGLKRSKDVEVTLVDKTNHHTFAPLLYQVATGGLTSADIASPARAVCKGQKNLTVLMGEMTAVDYSRKVVQIDGHNEGGQPKPLELPYDYLVLAIGGRTSYFGNDQWEADAPGMKSLRDALRIRNEVLYAFEQAERCGDAEEIKRLLTIVVIGGGPTGVELAGAFADLRAHVLRWDFRRIRPEHARVILIEGSPHVLNSFDKKLSEYGANHLTKMGVEVHLNERVQDVQTGLVVTDKGSYRAANIIWAAGVEGHKINQELASDRDRGNRISISEDLRIPGQDCVYCIGDMSSFVHPCSNKGKPHPGVAQVAIQQGALAAANIKRQIKGEPLKTFSYFDKGSMATIGRSAAVCEAMGLKLTGFIAWVGWLFIHLLYLIDFQNRLIVLSKWFWAYLTWKWNVRIITQFPEEPNPRKVKDPAATAEAVTEERSDPVSS